MCENCQSDELLKKFNDLINKYNNKKLTNIELLQKVQKVYGYISKETCQKISELTSLELSDIYSIITFYSEFKLSKNAKYNIEVCLGTACYVKGAEDIIKELKNILKVDIGEVTTDGKFVIHIARCLGCCSIAPVMKINDDIIGNIKVNDISKILGRYN